MNVDNQLLKDYIRNIAIRNDGISPSVVNDKKFHTILHNYLIPPPEGYADFDFVAEHKYTCESIHVPTSVVRFLAEQTKTVLDQINGKFTYAAFVFADSINKQQVQHHLHIQSLMDPLPNFKEIVIFISPDDAQYQVEYFDHVVDKNQVLREKLFLRNEQDCVRDYVNQHNLKISQQLVKSHQFGVFNGQNLIHGGKIVNGSGIWVILSMCECDIEITNGQMIFRDFGC